MQSPEAAARFFAARGYVEAIKMILTSPHQNDERQALTLLPMLMLAGFAIELYLKAWLLAAGVSSKSVRLLGHDLQGLMLAAENNGLPSLYMLRQLIDSVAPDHRAYTYRYVVAGGEFAALDWTAALPILDRLDNVTGYRVSDV